MPLTPDEDYTEGVNITLHDYDEESDRDRNAVVRVVNLEAEYAGV